MPYQPITYASLEWQENGEPYSSSFKDVYFRSEKGLEETHYVFLQGNGLPERWQDKERFTIVETGFGTGLNFLATWKLWNETKTPGAVLHYISFEQFPIRPADLRKIYKLWPEFKTQSDSLLAHYPPSISGLHRITLGEGSVVLSLAWGDVNLLLPELVAEVDAWFLDGFAPRQNPEMWTEILCNQMARLTVAGGTFATFTATGYVRRGLQRVGFEVEKQPGFAEKREMLKGRLIQASDKPKEGKMEEAPWFFIPVLPNYAEHKAIVIGGGLAGTATAYSLARRGWQVTLIERHDTLAQGASGNPAGILMPLVAAPDDVVGQFYLEAYRYAIQHLIQLSGQCEDFHWQQCGALQLMTKDTNRVRYKNASDHPALMSGMMQKISASDVSVLAGVKLTQDGWFFPQGGWVSPSLMCKAQVNAYPDDIQVLYHQEAITLEHDNRGWKVNDGAGKCLAQAPVVVVANAMDATRFEQCKELPLRRVRGQVTYLPSTKESKKLQTVLCYEGYMVPAVKNVHCVGATFHPDNESKVLSEADHEENIATLMPYLPNGLIGSPDISSLKGRVAFRAASPDRRPLVGAVPDVQQFRSDYNDLSHGKQYKTYPAGSYFPGLYVSLGHGSRGLVSTPIASELLASQIVGDPLPLEKSLVEALNPSRFFIRALKKA